MPRYEYSEGGLQGSHKFWEITLAGSSFTTRYGRIGTKGQSNTKRFGSDLEARAAHDSIIREKLNKGYRPVEGAQPVGDAVRVAAAENPERMAALQRDPDDEQAWLVYGDWLQSQGDPLVAGGP